MPSHLMKYTPAEKFYQDVLNRLNHAKIPYMIEGTFAFREQATKDFAEAVKETLILEKNLGKLQTEHKVFAFYYSPIRGAIHGEPLKIYPFLGSTRLEEPIDRFDASVVFHGHADLGTLKGETAKGIPVYNVALPLIRRINHSSFYIAVEL